MKISALASKIAKLEGKKHQASIGDIREILKCIYMIDFEMRVANAKGSGRDWELYEPSDVLISLNEETLKLVKKYIEKQKAKRGKK